MEHIPGQRITPEEIAIIMSKSTKEAHKLLPWRTPQVITQTRWHIRNRSGRPENKEPWSKAEIEALRTYYAKMETKLLIKKYLPNRSFRQVISKARALHLRKTYEPPTAFDGEKAIVEQIISVALQREIRLGQLDKMCGTRDYFLSGWRRVPLNVSAVSRALQILGGEFRAVFPEKSSADTQARLLRCLVLFQDIKLPKARLPKPPKARGSERLIGKAKNNAAVLAAVEKVVPQGIPDRADICQSILLALHEGAIRPEHLQDRAKVRTLIGAVRKANNEQSGYSVSLDQPRRDGRSWHDTLPGGMQ